MMSFDLAHPYGMQVVHCVILPNVASLWDACGLFYIIYRTLHPYGIQTVPFMFVTERYILIGYGQSRLCCFTECCIPWDTSGFVYVCYRALYPWG